MLGGVISELFEQEHHENSDLATAQAQIRSALQRKGLAYQDGGHIVQGTDDTTIRTRVPPVLGEELGQGGFGRVFKYRDELLDFEFAVKVFDPHPFNTTGAVNKERFLREAAILLKLNSPEIIRVYDVGQLRDGRPYFKMEYFAGVDLNRYLKESGPLAPKEALRVAGGVARALHHAHSNNVVHRDLKPSNVMFNGCDDVRVIDFGMGILLEEDLANRLTRSSQTASPTSFSAPELLVNPKLVSHSIDLYSLGAVWFKLLVGLAPLGSDLEKNLRNVEGVSALYADTVLRCLRSAPERYQSAAELLVDLRTLWKATGI